MTGRYPFQSLKLSIAAICEYALESRGRWTLVGTFRQLEFAAFPATLNRLEVYLLLTDVTTSGVSRLGLSLWPPSTDVGVEELEPILQGRTPAGMAAFPESLEGVFRFTDVVFPTPGRYDLYVEVNDDVFELITLFVRRSK